jgi:flagellum-specific ATP synthase
MSQGLEQAIRASDPIARTGRVRRVLSTFVEADGPAVELGARCAIETRGPGGLSSALAQAVCINRDSIILAPFDSAATFPGARVTALAAHACPIGDAVLGRALDALGRPIDGQRPVLAAPLSSHPRVSPLDRVSPKAPLETGVRAIDGLVTLGKGQRVGLFAAAGVGKTSLLTQLAQQVQADRCVICLIGERGREVEALWMSDLPPAVRSRTVLVAATSDETAAMRAQAADYALELAEHWRGQGHHVLLLLDSATRLAMALREIGLAAGEPPTVRAYTPNVFSTLPKVVERCGAIRSGGAISAVMTVLSETDEVDDPVSEMMKSLLDGHIVLSRELAERGHYPAIDIGRSISRLAARLATPAHRGQASTVRQWLATYETSRALIETGVYVAGSNAEIDLAIAKRPGLTAFLRQDQDTKAPLSQTRSDLAALTGAG